MQITSIILIVMAFLFSQSIQAGIIPSKAQSGRIIAQMTMEKWYIHCMESTWHSLQYQFGIKDTIQQKIHQGKTRGLHVKGH